MSNEYTAPIGENDLESVIVWSRESKRETHNWHYRSDSGTATPSFPYLENIVFPNQERNIKVVAQDYYDEIGIYTREKPLMKPISKKNWLMNIKPRHLSMLGVGFFLILIGFFDLILGIISKNGTLLFWTNDFLLMFGGLVISQVALKYAITLYDEE
jgi:hypothetical protein